METTNKNQVVLTEAQITFYLESIKNGLIDELSLKADIKRQLGLLPSSVKENVAFKNLQKSLKTEDPEQMKHSVINTYGNAGVRALKANYGEDILTVMEAANWSIKSILNIGSKTPRSAKFKGAYVVEKDGTINEFKTWVSVWEYYLDADPKNGHAPLSNNLVAYQWDFKSCNNSALNSLIEKIGDDGGTLYLRFEGLDDYKCTANISNSIIKKYVRLNDDVEEIEEV